MLVLFATLIAKLSLLRTNEFAGPAFQVPFY